MEYEQLVLTSLVRSQVISFPLAQIKYLAMRHMGVASMSKLRGPAWAHSVRDGA